MRTKLAALALALGIGLTVAPAAQGAAVVAPTADVFTVKAGAIQVNAEGQPLSRWRLVVDEEQAGYTWPMPRTGQSFTSVAVPTGQYRACAQWKPAGSDQAVAWETVSCAWITVWPTRTTTTRR